MVLIKRTLLVFFRDRSAVFFSLLAVLIIIGLYALFLGDVMVSSIGEDLPDAKQIMYQWLFAGLLTVSGVTTSMGAFAIMIEDKTKRVSDDFYALPRRTVTLGYVGGAFVVGSLMSLITLIIAEIFIVLNGGAILPPVKLLACVGLLLLNVLASAAIVTFIVGFFKTQSQFGAANSIISTLIGFITGIYLPVGSLPDYAQTVVKAFPLSHSAALFRQILTDDTLKNALGDMEAAREIRESLGITLGFHWGVSLLIIAATAIVFFALSAAAARLTPKR